MPGLGVIHNPAHHQVGDSVQDLGYDGQHSQKRTAPHRCQVQRIGVERVQIALPGNIEHAHDKSRAEQIAKPCSRWNLLADVIVTFGDDYILDRQSACFFTILSPGRWELLSVEKDIWPFHRRGSAKAFGIL